MYVHFWATQSMNQKFKFKTAQNSKNLRLFYNSSFEFQTRNYVTCFGHICKPVSSFKLSFLRNS